MRILVTGASGLLGKRLAELALQKGHDVISSYKNNVPVHGKPLEVDLTRSTAVRKAFLGVRPDVIINTAAMTDVDKCELEPEAAFSANSKAVCGT